MRLCVSFVLAGLALALGGCGGDVGSTTRVEPTPSGVLNPAPATNVGEPPAAGGSPENVLPQGGMTPGSARSGTSAPATPPETNTRSAPVPALPRNPLKTEKP